MNDAQLQAEKDNIAAGATCEDKLSRAYLLIDLLFAALKDATKPKAGVDHEEDEVPPPVREN